VKWPPNLAYLVALKTGSIRILVKRNLAGVSNVGDITKQNLGFDEIAEF